MFNSGMTYDEEEQFLSSIDLMDDSLPSQTKLFALNILLNRPDEDDIEVYAS